MPVPTRPKALAHRGCPLRAAWRIARRFHRLSAASGWVAYALRTRPPLSAPPKGRLPFDLHVLGLPLAFILSQDQTLRCSIAVLLNYSESRVPIHPALTRGKVLPCFLLSRYAPNGPRLCAGLRLSKNLLPHPSFHPLFPSEADCKSTTILVNGNQKFQLFSIKCYILL